jgi:hypothetical protein
VLSIIIFNKPSCSSGFVTSLILIALSFSYI